MSVQHSLGVACESAKLRCTRFDASLFHSNKLTNKVVTLKNEHNPRLGDKCPLFSRTKNSTIKRRAQSDQLWFLDVGEQVTFGNCPELDCECR